MVDCQNRKYNSEWTATDVNKEQMKIRIGYQGGTIISLASNKKKKKHDVSLCAAVILVRVPGDNLQTIAIIVSAVIFPHFLNSFPINVQCIVTSYVED